MKRFRLREGFLVCAGLMILMPLSMGGCGVSELRGFETLSEFKNWITDHVQPDTTYAEDSFLAAYKVQQEGMADGYLMGIDLDYFEDDDTWVVAITVFVGNELYWWVVEDDEMYAGYDFYK